MHKFITSEDLSGKLSKNRTLYEILTIDSELLFFNLFKMKYYFTSFKIWNIEFLWKMCYQRENR